MFALVRYPVVFVTILWFYLFYLTHLLNARLNLLSNVNPKCFCDYAWKTLLFMKRKGEWQTFFSFLEKNTSWDCLLGSGLQLIFHWKAHYTTHCFLFVKKCFKIFNKLPNIPFSCNLNIRPSWQFLSKAFEMSRKHH